MILNRLIGSEYAQMEKVTESKSDIFCVTLPTATPKDCTVLANVKKPVMNSTPNPRAMKNHGSPGVPALTGRPPKAMLPVTTQET